MRGKGEVVRSRRIGAVAAAAVFVGVVLGVSCGTEAPSPSVAAPEPDGVDARIVEDPRGSVLPGGIVVRDAQTKAQIAATADVALAEHRGADLQLVVTNSRYRLDVIRSGERLKTFPIVLGDEPRGTKRRRGDERTPEGEYVLVPHHPSPSFGGCFYVC